MGELLLVARRENVDLPGAGPDSENDAIKLKKGPSPRTNRVNRRELSGSSGLRQLLSMFSPDFCDLLGGNKIVARADTDMASFCP